MYDNEHTCPICLDPIADGGSKAAAWFSTGCGHMYHHACWARFCESRRITQMRDLGNDCEIRCPLCNTRLATRALQRRVDAGHGTVPLVVNVTIFMGTPDERGDDEAGPVPDPSWVGMEGSIALNCVLLILHIFYILGPWDM
jgi:hypothetical protein